MPFVRRKIKGQNQKTRQTWTDGPYRTYYLLEEMILLEFFTAIGVPVTVTIASGQVWLAFGNHLLAQSTVAAVLRQAIPLVLAEYKVSDELRAKLQHELLNRS